MTAQEFEERLADLIAVARNNDVNDAVPLDAVVSALELQRYALLEEQNEQQED